MCCFDDFICASGHISPQKSSSSPVDALSIFARRCLSRHISHDLLFPKKFSRAFSHLQLEQSRDAPFVHVKLRSFTSTCRRALRDRARSALFFKQLEHVFRLGLRFETPTTRLHVEQKNMCASLTHARTHVGVKTKVNDDDASHARDAEFTSTNRANFSRGAAHI